MIKQDAYWSLHRLRWGYFPTLSKITEGVAVIQSPSEYQGHEHLELACTQTTLKPYAQRKLVAQWCELLPELPLRSIAFRTRVNQSLFDAASKNRNIKSLFVKWGRISSIATLEGHLNIEAIHLGSFPDSGDLAALSSIDSLRHLFIADAPVDMDYSIFNTLVHLRELGLSQPRGKWTELKSLDFLVGLNELELLWLRGYRLKDSVLPVLGNLAKLASIRSSWREESTEMAFIVNELSNVKYHEAVFH
jgi:hypothetical protein